MNREWMKRGETERVSVTFSEDTASKQTGSHTGVGGRYSSHKCGRDKRHAAGRKVSHLHLIHVWSRDKTGITSGKIYRLSELWGNTCRMFHRCLNNSTVCKPWQRSARQKACTPKYSGGVSQRKIHEGNVALLCLV